MAMGPEVGEVDEGRGAAWTITSPSICWPAVCRVEGAVLEEGYCWG